MPMQTKIGKTTLRLVTGDIADQDTDAVVTAAHWRLNKGTGTDGTIHTKGGPRIYEECRRIGGCPTDPIGDGLLAAVVISSSGYHLLRPPNGHRRARRCHRHHGKRWIYKESIASCESEWDH